MSLGNATTTMSKTKDIKIGVTMLRMEDMRVKEHFIRNSVRITRWTQMREEILEITRTQHYIDSRLVPIELDANPKAEGKDKATARTSRAKARARTE